MSNGINLNALSANTVLASTFSQASYYIDTNGQRQPLAIIPPAGFEEVSFQFQGRQSLGFEAVTYVNKTTGQVVIAFRGSDNVGEALGIAATSANTGSWDLQFTDATNYTVQAKAVALEQINAARRAGEPPLPDLTDVQPGWHAYSETRLTYDCSAKRMGNSTQLAWLCGPRRAGMKRQCRTARKAASSSRR